MITSILMSIHPEWCKHIFINQDKIYEVRKRVPPLKLPYKVYVYCTLKRPLLSYDSGFFKGNLNGLVIGEFTCTNHIKRSAPWIDKANGTCLTDGELEKYANGNDLTFMEISNPILYMKPRTVKELMVTRPPQSFCYCKELEDV